MFVVKILAIGFGRAMDSDVLASILLIQFGKLQRILKTLEISVHILSVGEGISFARSAVHMAQIV